MKIELPKQYTDELADEVRRVHRASLPADVLPNLDRSYYREAVRLMLKFGALSVARDQGRIVGFCSILYSTDDFTDELASKWGALFRNLARIAITKPRLIADLFASAKGKIHFDEPMEYRMEGQAEIGFIGIDPAHQSKGIGRQLIDACVAEDAGPILLVRTSAPRAEKFYIRNGFHKVGFQDRRRRNVTILMRVIHA